MIASRRFLCTLLFLLCGAGAIFMSACGSSQSAVADQREYREYVDSIVGFTVRYPLEWIPSAQAGKWFTVVSSSNAIGNGEFGEGGEGLVIKVTAFQGDETTVQDAVSELKELFRGRHDEFQGTTVVTHSRPTKIQGMQGTELIVNYDGRGGSFASRRYYLAFNGMVTCVETIIYGGASSYGAIFAEVLRTFTPAIRPSMEFLKK